jgi:hypothetical protein
MEFLLILILSDWEIVQEGVLSLLMGALEGVV